MPVVCAQLGGDRRRIRTALLAGSALPLAMFVSWDAVMLALTGVIALPVSSSDRLQLDGDPWYRAWKPGGCGNVTQAYWVNSAALKRVCKWLQGCPARRDLAAVASRACLAMFAPLSRSGAQC